MTSSTPTLEILVCTYGHEGISRLASGVLPRADGLRYLISWQLAEGDEQPLPQALYREDIRVLRLSGRGLSANRNAALDHAKGPLCLWADDDLTFNLQGLRSLVGKIDQHHEIGFALARYTGADNKTYPAEEYRLGTLAKGHFVTSFEIAFRLSAVREAGVRFNTRFGAGNDDYQACEEELWIHGLLKKGVGGMFFPIDIVTHEGLTTGFASAVNPGVLRATGAYLAVAYPLTALPRMPLIARRRARAAGVSAAPVLMRLAQGYFRALFMPRSLGL